MAESLTREQERLTSSLMIAGGNNISALHIISAMCNRSLDSIDSNTTVRHADVRDVLEGCLLHQDVVSHLADVEGGRLDFAAGARPSTALHHAAHFGSAAVTSTLLDLASKSESVHGFVSKVLVFPPGSTTPLHVACARGHVEVAVVLAKNLPALVSAVDEYGRTPWDVVCLQRWVNVGEFAAVLGRHHGDVDDCGDRFAVQTAPPPPPQAHSWSGVDGFGANGNVNITCDFDVREDLTAAEFIEEYVSPTF